MSSVFSIPLATNSAPPVKVAMDGGRVPGENEGKGGWMGRRERREGSTNSMW